MHSVILIGLLLLVLRARVFLPNRVALHSNMDLPSTETVEGTPSYPVNCSNFTSIQFWYLDLARGISGAVALLVCSLILFLILLHKAYASLLQRFLLYSTLATWLAEASFTMQIEHLVKYAGQRQFCVTVAFMEQWTSSMVIAIALEITLLLTYRVYVTLQRQFLDCSSWSKCSRVSLESIAVSLAVFIPLAMSVVPLVRGTYGVSGAWCWITTLNAECERKNVWDQDTLGTVPYVVPGIVIGICVVFVIVLFCISACQSSDSRRLNCKMIRDNLVLLAFYVVFFTFCSIELSAQLLSGTTHAYDKYPMWLVNAIGPPLNKLALLLGFLFYMYSLKKLTLGSFQVLRRICCRCCPQCRPQTLNTKDDASGPIQNVTGGPTYRSSHPQVYPSETVFYPPYTGAFTSISKKGSSCEGERQQLISSLDVGYCSFRGNAEHELQRTS